MKLIESFDEEVKSLVNFGENRQAISCARKIAAHALMVAAGVYMNRLADYDTALQLSKLSIEAEPKNPVLYGELLYLLCQLGAYEEALKYSSIALSLPDPPASVFFNHGIACKCLDKLDDAVVAFRKTCELEPNYAMAHYNLGRILMAQGHYEEGLKEHEWRLKSLFYKSKRKRYKQPDWNGKDSLAGKRVLLYNEQGFGDGIHYSMYISKLKATGAHVILELKKEVYNLYLNTPHIDELVRFEDSPTECDYAISLASLMYFFDPKLEIGPAAAYIKPAGKIGPITGDGFKVGIVWAGSLNHLGDSTRSCFLKEFEPLSLIPNVKLYSLQEGDMRREWEDRIVNLMEGSERVKYVNLAGSADFNETALKMQQLDLVVGVDTSVIHLAGAMGLPVWNLLAYDYEWRWRDGKKWYASMRLFRQPSPGDWNGLIDNVAKELTRLVVGRNAVSPLL